MNEPIFSSNNEEGLLKSCGPYRIPTADMSISGLRLARVIRLATPSQVGVVQIHGTSMIVEPTTPPAKESENAA
jgi:hypothetical protein